MARNIPFRVPHRCIDCGGAIKLSLHEFTLRCDDCFNAVRKLRSDAAVAIKDAVARGDLTPVQTNLCTDCEQPAVDYDHRDYREPLKVVPVCRKCNQRRGPAFWRDGPTLLPRSKRIEQPAQA